MKNKVFISILTILISIPLFMDTPLANTTNIQTTNHGTITYDVSGDSNESNQMGITLGPLTFNVAGKKVSTFTYELDNVYTGTITMQGMGPYFSGGHGTQYNCELYMTNCTVADRSDDKITFYIKEQSSFSVSLVRDNDGTMQYNDWYQIYSETLTAAGSELNTLNAIYVYVHSLSDDVLDIKQSVINNLPDIYTALGYDVDNTSSTMRTDLESLKTIMNNIGTQIGTFSGTTLAGTMTSMQSYLISVDQKLDYIRTNTTSIINAINTLHLDINSLSNINRNININPESDLAYLIFRQYGELKFYNNDKYPYYTINPDTYSSRVYLYRTKKYYLSFRTYNYSDPWPWSSIHLLDNTFNDVTYNRYYLDQYGGYSLVTIEITPPTTGYYYFKLDGQFANQDFIPIYFGTADNLSDVMASMTHITTQGNAGIMNKLDAVVNAINSMSLNVNQMTVNATGITYNVNNTQVNNSVNTYNTDIQNVYNVENNFSIDFNTYNQQFTPDFTETMNTIQNVPSVMNDVVVDLYNLPFIKYPVLLTLAGIVLIALLGV